jgi:mRNA guanylyltransferase
MSRISKDGAPPVKSIFDNIKKSAQVDSASQKEKAQAQAGSGIIDQLTPKYWQGRKERSNEDPKLIMRNFLKMREEEFRREVSKDTKVELEVRLGLLVFSHHDHLPATARVGPQRPGAKGEHIDNTDMVVPSSSGCKVKFQPGVSASTFAHFKKLHEKRNQTKCPTESRSYAPGLLPQDATRAEINLDDRKVSLEAKRELAHYDIHLPACDYDIRVSVMTETAIGDTMWESQLPDGWDTLRNKDRVSYEHPNRDKWRLDLTNTTTVTNNSDAPPQKSYEVELELTGDSCKKWLEAEGQANSYVDQIVHHVWDNFLFEMLPSEPATGGIVPVKDQSVVSGCKAAFSKLNYRKFPGAMPTSFHRHHIADIQNDVGGEYYVSEKSDGVRYLLAVAGENENKRAVLFDRLFAGFEVKGVTCAIAKGLPSGTVLDGEVVHNRSLGKPQFMIFDILALGGDSKVQDPYQARKQCIAKAVEMVHQVDETSKRTVLQKDFVKRKYLREVFKNIHDLGEGFLYQPPVKGPGAKENGRSYYLRSHKTDGIIFQPNTPYVMGTDNKLLKWKWGQLCSVDFKVTLDKNADAENCLQFDAGSVDQTLLDFTKHIHMDVFDRTRLLGDMLGLNKMNVIAELAFQQDTGNWVYMQLRPDKDTPNFIHTVIATIMEMAEGVSKEELEYRMLCENSNEDEWDKLITSRMQEITKRKKDKLSAAKRY